MPIETNNKKRYIIMCSDRHSSYGLFDDLTNIENVQVIAVKQKEVHHPLANKLKRIHLSRAISTIMFVPFKHLWYNKPHIVIEDNYEYYLIIVDIVLYSISIRYLKAICKKTNVKCILLMLNSVSTDAIKQVKREIGSIQWNTIYTYDDIDAAKYGYKKAGYCYYSKHDEKKIGENYSKDYSDAYFIGTMKASRKSIILQTYGLLRRSGLLIEYHILKTLRERKDELPYKDEIDYFTSDKGLIPYDEILASIIKTKIIIEIIQEGQAGPSLRYYEAVCYNKKLLTNNPYITSFPYYDSRYMKVFNSAEDIDVKWLKEDIIVDYHYCGDFSPTHFIEKIENEG